MNNRILFTKMHGLGNDFVVIDLISPAPNTRAQILRALTAERIRAWSKRHTGIGFDQLLLLEPTQQAGIDFHYRIFNADGSEVNQCGNGARCIAAFAQQQGLCSKSQMTVSTKNNILRIDVRDHQHITVAMGEPNFNIESLPFTPNADTRIRATHTNTAPNTFSIELNNQTIEFALVSLGNPHAVIILNSVNDDMINKIGHTLSTHACFPEGCNIGFLQRLTPHSATLRVFERGAGETLACGSGACAAAVVGIQQNLLQSPVDIHLKYGHLHIAWQGSNTPIFMSGPATTVFQGYITHD